MKAALRLVVSLNTKKYCIISHDIALYLQQHPTRLCKQLYPQTVGLLFSNTPQIIMTLPIVSYLDLLATHETIQ